MRDRRSAWLGIGGVLLATTLLVWWPGLLSAPARSAFCDRPGVSTEAVDGNTFCIESTTVYARQCSNLTVVPNQLMSRTVFLGFTFEVGWAAGSFCGDVAVLNISVTNPADQTYHGSLILGGPTNYFPDVWIAPDNESGFDWRAGNPVVMVAANA